MDGDQLNVEQTQTINDIKDKMDASTSSRPHSLTDKERTNEKENQQH